MKFVKAFVCALVFCSFAAVAASFDDQRYVYDPLTPNFYKGQKNSQYAPHSLPAPRYATSPLEYTR